MNRESMEVCRHCQHLVAVTQGMTCSNCGKSLTRGLDIDRVDEPSQVPKEILSPEDTRLRDTFAAHALSGLLAGKLIAGIPHPSGHPMAPRLIQSEDAAEAAYKMADAMMKARKG